MTKNNRKVLLLLAGVFTVVTVFGKVGDKVPDFSLKNTDGKLVGLNSFPKARGFIIVFTCNHCPFAKRYEDRLNAFSVKYARKGYPLLAISSTDVNIVKEDGYTEMVRRAAARHFRFHYLFDSTQMVAKSFGALKTPHAFVVIKEGSEYVVKYSGAIDDNGDEPEKATHHYVTDALDALIAGKAITVQTTKSIGCSINFRK